MNFDDVDFEEVLPDGQKRYRLLESGAVVDNTTKKFVARKITPEQAAQMATKRWEGYRSASASRILKEAQAIDPDVQTEQEAFALLVGRTFIAIMDSDKPRGKDLESVAKAIGASPTIADVKQVQEEEQNQYKELVEEYVFRLLEQQQRETVEGRVIEPYAGGEYIEKLEK